MDLDDLFALSPGEYVYISLLYRTFGSQTPGVIEKLIDSKLFTSVTLYRCPHCYLAMFNSGQEVAGTYLSQEDVFCYGCEADVKIKDLQKEQLLVRADNASATK